METFYRHYSLAVEEKLDLIELYFRVALYQGSASKKILLQEENQDLRIMNTH